MVTGRDKSNCISNHMYSVIFSDNFKYVTTGPCVKSTDEEITEGKHQTQHSVAVWGDRKSK